jgi:hypothetical protein
MKLGEVVNDEQAGIGIIPADQLEDSLTRMFFE